MSEFMGFRICEGVMRITRYELSDAQWVRIKPLLPGKRTDPGLTDDDNRSFVNGFLWVLRSGARWSNLPERYGKYKKVISASPAGRVFTFLAHDRDNEYLMIDSSVVCPCPSDNGPKGGSATRF